MLGVGLTPEKPVALLDLALEMSRNSEEREELGRNGLSFYQNVLTRESAIDKFERWALSTTRKGESS